MRWRRQVMAGSVVVVLALAGAGCADDGGSVEASAGDSTTSAAARDSTSTSSPPATHAPSPTPEDLQAFADELVATTGSDGGIVAVQRGGEHALIVASGVAHGTDDKIDVTDAFHVASVTKSYVAAALLSLAAEGAVDLDAPIAQWLDWPGGDVITIRHLLQNTSGVAPFGNDDGASLLFTQLVIDNGREYTLDEVLEATRELAPAGELGSSTYSNLNFVLGAAIIEAATGQSAADVVTERVLAEVGLDHTWYPGDARPRPEPLPGIYDLQSGADPISTADFSMSSWETLTAGGSGAISTMEDYLAWGNEVFRDQRLGEADLAVMSEIGPNGYGLGVVGVAADGACVFDGCDSGTEFTRMALNGDMPGSSTRLMYDPATDTMFGVYLNRNALSLDGPMIGFLEEHLG